jgi:hypothetical protein
MKTLNRRTWAIMIVTFNPRLRTRLPRIAAEVQRLGLGVDRYVKMSDRVGKETN